MLLGAWAPCRPRRIKMSNSSCDYQKGRPRNSSRFPVLFRSRNAPQGKMPKLPSAIFDLGISEVSKNRWLGMMQSFTD